MAIPGVVPSDQLLSLTNQEEDGSIGAILGSGSAAEAAYRASLAGQNAPIFGKGGFQGATLAGFNPLFSLDDETDDGISNPIEDITNIISDGADNANVPVVGGAIGPSGTFNPNLNQTQYGALTNLVQDNIGNLNLSVPGVGDVNVPNLAVNTALDSTFNVVPGLGLVSTLVNPTMVETSWGTPFNTGGGGLIGAVGQLSLNNLENIYGETQSGTEGYDFYAPGSLPGTTTPIGLSPGLFGFGTVVSGNTDMMPSQADLNNDGTITADEVKAFSDPTSSGAQAYQDIQENKTVSNQQMLDYIQQQKDSGGSAFVGGSVVTDSSGKAVTSGDGSKPVTSGGTFTNFGALPDKTETTGNIFSSVGNFFSDFMSSEPEPESKPTEDLTSQSIMDAITSGMQKAKDDPRPAGTFEVASSGMFANDASSDDNNNNDQSGSGTSTGSGISSGSGVSPTAAGEYSTSSSSSNIAATANDKDGTTSSSNDNNDSDSNGGGGCVIATHGIMTGGFTPMEKAKAELWCQKTYHGKWYGEAFRRGYRAAGQRCIDQGKAREHYQEFKDFVAYGRGVKKGLMLGIKYYARTTQFFVTGLFIKEN